jgi:hypothetical protein
MANDKMQRATGWGSFLEGILSRDWKTVQDTHHIMIGSRKRGSIWAHGVIRQLWKAAFCLWLHRNSWQHSDNNPQHKRDIADLDHHITDNYTLRTAAVLPEHHHIFTMSLETRLQTPLLDKQSPIHR